jgi:hypothetical protein
MNPDQYLGAVLEKYDPYRSGRLAQVQAAGTDVAEAMRSWFSQSLAEVLWSGSYAKGTTVLPSTDTDLFLSFHPNTDALRDMFSEVEKAAAQLKWNPKRQSVSLRITYNGVAIDLVPGRRQSSTTTDHSIYRTCARTWTKTNVQTHIDTVKASGLSQAMRVIKVWRNLRKLSFPSFAVELVVMEAVRRSGLRSRSMADVAWETLGFLGTGLEHARLLDPANGANNVAEDMTAEERRLIAAAGRESRTKKTWSEVVW